MNYDINKEILTTTYKTTKGNVSDQSDTHNNDLYKFNNIFMKKNASIYHRLYAIFT